MDTKKLRQKILDLAIHGKLVPQDPNDEPASVLLERIRAEKERLVKEGKIKKSKATKTSDTPHYENRQVGEANVPFEVPGSWEWTTLGEICSIKGGKRIPKGKAFSKEKTDHVYLRVTDMKNNTIIMSDLRYIDDDVFSEIESYTINSSDLYLTIAGTIGAVGIVPETVNGMNLTENAAKLTNISCDKMYLMYSLLSTIAQEHFSSRFHQVAQPKLSIETASKTPIPLPPIEEQERVVVEIEKWLALIETIESGKADLQTAIKQAKSKILDLAIHGKLIPQDPNDEPASELLKRINPKAEITCDNGQYQNLPKGWCLVTGTSLFKQMKSAKPKGDLFKYIDIDSIDNKSNIVSSIKEIPTIEAPSRASRYTEKGDVVFSMVRPYLRNIARITENDCIASTGFYICSPYKYMLSKFCYYLMLSNYVVDGLNTFMKGDNSPSITKREIDNWLYPLPPMNEQYHIVAKIEEIFTILDRIELSL